jgi:hypothetical protein
MSGNIPIDNPAIRTYWIAYDNSLKKIVEGWGFVDPEQKLLSKWFIDETVDEDEWIAELAKHGIDPFPPPIPPDDEE